MDNEKFSMNMQMPCLDKNKNSVLRQLTALENMSEKELREKWRALYGAEPPQFKSRFLKKRLAYRIQELFYGGISESVKEKLSEMAASDPLATLIEGNGKFHTCRRNERKIVANGKILPGTRFIREWNGRQYEAIAREDGFEYNGRMFRSLSAVASEITGVKWNGLVFWGLKKSGVGSPESGGKRRKTGGRRNWSPESGE